MHTRPEWETSNKWDENTKWASTYIHTYVILVDELDGRVGESRRGIFNEVVASVGFIKR